MVTKLKQSRMKSDVVVFAAGGRTNEFKGVLIYVLE